VQWMPGLRINIACHMGGVLVERFMSWAVWALDILVRI